MAAAASSVSIPPGYRFEPTKQEILLCYLLPASKGEAFPCDVVVPVDIYGKNKEPWKLFDDKESQRGVWIFTKLKRKSRSKIDRVAGCGCWLHKGTANIKDSHGMLLGADKYYIFKCKRAGEDPNPSQGNWTMHEFSLKGKGSEDYVICEIRRKDEVEAENKKREADVDDFRVRKKVCVDDALNVRNHHDLQENFMVISSCSEATTDHSDDITNGSVSVNYPDDSVNGGGLLVASSANERGNGDGGVTSLNGYVPNEVWTDLEAEVDDQIDWTEYIDFDMADEQIDWTKYFDFDTADECIESNTTSRGLIGSSEVEQHQTSRV